MSKIESFLKTEPALLAGLVQPLIALAVATGWHLTPAESGAIMAASTAILGLITAAYARPFQVPALTGAVGAVVTLLATFGVPGIHPGLIGAINGAVVAVMAIVLRSNVTPVVTLQEQAIKPPPATGFKLGEGYVEVPPDAAA